MTDEAGRIEARRRARIRAFEFVHEIQAGAVGAVGALEGLSALSAQAGEKGWSEIERIGLFGRAVNELFNRGSHAGAAVAALIQACEADSDPVMLALGLALRSDRGFAGDLTKRGDVADLAKAVVLLEQADRSEHAELERISAHNACGIAFANRSLFELADEQYRAALAIGDSRPPGSFAFLLAPTLFNRAELDVAWASMLRQLDDAEGVEQRWQSWKAASAAMGRYEIRPSWKTELAALGLLLESIARVDTAVSAASLVDELERQRREEPRAVGLLRLSIALADAATGRLGAAAAAEEAVGAIDPDFHPQIHDLALYIAAEIDARGGESSGLRYARRQLAKRWANRLETLRSMEVTIDAERVANELETQSAHALLDDLTSLANRRALGHYVAKVASSEVKSIAVIMIDIDGFKKVNDVHGHLAGDAVLIAIARILSANVRPMDLAVRLGGDELAAILSGTDQATAFERATKILSEFDKHSFDAVSDGLSVSLSAGVSAGNVSRLRELLAEADAAMYRAKARSRLTVAGSSVESARDGVSG